MPAAAAQAPSQGKRNEETWNALLVAYREHPRNHTQVAKATGLHRATCKNAFDHGWPEHPFAATPLRTILAREENERHKALLEAKLKVLDGEELAEEEERKHRLLARKDEQEAMTRARQNMVGIVAVTTNVLRSGAEASKLLNKRVEQLSQQPALSIADSAELQAILRTSSAFATRAGALMRNTMEMQRILTNTPIATIGVRNEAITAEDVVASMQQIARSLTNAHDEEVHGTAIEDAAWEELHEGEGDEGDTLDEEDAPPADLAPADRPLVGEHRVDDRVLGAGDSPTGEDRSPAQTSSSAGPSNRDLGL